MLFPPTLGPKPHHAAVYALHQGARLWRCLEGPAVTWPKLRGSWRLARFLLMAVLLVSGGATALHLSILLERQADGITRYIRVDTWAVQRVEYELQRFRSMFARHVAGDDGVTMKNLWDQLAGVRSTASLLRRGEHYEQFRLLVDIDGAAKAAFSTLEEVERTLGDRTEFRGDLPILRRIEQTLTGLIYRLRKLSVDMVHIQRELQDGDLTNVRWRIGINRWMLIAFFAAVTVFIAVLLMETHAAKRAEARAEVAWKRLTEAIESIHEGFALFDGSDRLVLANSQYRQFIFAADEPLTPGLRFGDAMRLAAESGRISDADGRIEDWLRERIERHRACHGTFEERLDDGTHLLISERKTFDGGVVAINTDISELKAREKDLQLAVQKAETANRSKTEFLANMSHELRTPLNAVIGFSDLMMSEMLGPVGNPTYRDYLTDINSSGKHLLEIINDILDISRIEAGEDPLDEQEFDIGSVIQACVRMVRPRAAKLDHVISVDLPETLPALYGDERAVKQVLLNLLSNAVKFTPEGGDISVKAEPSLDGSLIVKVADTGVGIAKEDIPKALEYFGQVDSSLARKFEGTGLGLSLALKLVEWHGGTMLLDSAVDVGTTVIIRFPPERVISPDSAAPC